MNQQDIRWQQRFSHYQKALLQLSNAVDLSRQRPLSELEEQGLIQSFEYIHEPAWNVMKDYFEYQGNTSITGSRDATREAFRRNLIIDGEGWMEMIDNRNKTLLIYNPEVADEIAKKVIDVYHELFTAFEKRMPDLKDVG